MKGVIVGLVAVAVVLVAGAACSDSAPRDPTPAARAASPRPSGSPAPTASGSPAPEPRPTPGPRAARLASALLAPTDLPAGFTVKASGQPDATTAFTQLTRADPSYEEVLTLLTLKGIPGVAYVTANAEGFLSSTRQQGQLSTFQSAPAPAIGEDTVRYTATLPDGMPARAAELIAFRQGEVLAVVYVTGATAADAVPYARAQQRKLAGANLERTVNDPAAGRYLEQHGQLLAKLAEQVTLVGTLNAEARPAEAAWRNQYRDAALAMRQSVGSIRALQPPPCLRDAADQELRGLTAYELGADSVLKGLTLAEQRPEDGTQTLIEAANTIGQANKFLERSASLFAEATC